MRHSTDLLIVGGGIAGLTCALAAADAGMHVTVLDERRAGSASRAAAGMLAPSLDGLPSAVQPQAFEARDLYPAFLAALRDRSGIDVPLNRRGIIEVGQSEPELIELVAKAPAWAMPMEREQLARMEPELAGHAGALFHQVDGAVDNVRLMDALEVAVLRAPAIHRVHVSVTSIDLGTSGPRVHAGAGTAFSGQKVLLASGAWASGLPGLPRALPVRPLCGQLMRVDSASLSHVVFAAGGYLIPRGASLLVGATSEETGFESKATREGLQMLRAIASCAIPSLGNAVLLDHWAGLRPVTPDALPILGADPEVPSLLYACGFSRNGILLAPWAAKQMAHIFVGHDSPPALVPFAASRFLDAQTPRTRVAEE